MHFFHPPDTTIAGKSVALSTHKFTSLRLTWIQSSEYRALIPELQSWIQSSEYRVLIPELQSFLLAARFFRNTLRKNAYALMVNHHSNS